MKVIYSITAVSGRVLIFERVRGKMLAAVVLATDNAFDDLPDPELSPGRSFTAVVGFE